MAAESSTPTGDSVAGLNTTPPTVTLPPPFNNEASAATLTLITQGAEARLYRTTFLDAHTPAALKVRPTKAWRHPTLDRRLTRARILAEARVLVKCRREGVPVPAVRALDWEAGWMVSEWIPGRTVKAAVKEWDAGMRERTSQEEQGAGGDGDAALKGLLGKIGQVIGKLHSVGIVHGDLTTSNMMLRQETHEQQGDAAGSGLGANMLEGEIVLIDFGLATQAVQDEDRAVDLYVLERAFGSTHPRQEDLFSEVLAAYASSYKGAKATLKKLEDVRIRGRKKSMIG